MDKLQDLAFRISIVQGKLRHPRYEHARDEGYGLIRAAAEAVIADFPPTAAEDEDSEELPLSTPLRERSQRAFSDLDAFLSRLRRPR